MMKSLRNTLMVSAAILLASTSAHANINASLKTVCINAQSTANQVVDKKLNAEQKQYRARLANYYKGVSCNGKTLLTQTADKLKQSGGTIAERHLLK